MRATIMYINGGLIDWGQMFNIILETANFEHTNK